MEVTCLDSFNKIEISVPSSVFITQGDAESVRIEADKDIRDMIVTEVQGRVLRIRYKHSRYFRPRNKEVNIYIAAKELNGISISSSGTIKADDISTDDLDISISGSGDLEFNGLNADRLNVALAGSGKFDMAGYVENQSIRISGSGKYFAGELISKICTISISGSGEALVNVAESLNVRISGRGDVSYIGQPSISKSISGSGTIKAIE